MRESVECGDAQYVYAISGFGGEDEGRCEKLGKGNTGMSLFRLVWERLLQKICYMFSMQSFATQEGMDAQVD